MKLEFVQRKAVRFWPGHGTTWSTAFDGNAAREADIFVFGAAGATGALDNAGTLTKNGGGVSVIGDAITYTNSGTVSVLDGILDLPPAPPFDNVLITGAGADTVTGGAGTDSLDGGAGADTLDGGDGNDTINGGAGLDTITGGTGDDTFIFSAGQADGDVLADFSGNGAAAGDMFVFEGFGTAAGGATFEQVDATHWRITSADGLNVEVITVANGASIDPNDFLFGGG